MNRSIIVATSLLLAAAGSAAAGTLTTGPHIVDATTSLGCAVSNVGKKAVDVTIEWVGADGAVLNQVQDTLAPGGSNRSVTAFPSFDLAHCRFRFKGGRNKMRGAAHVFGAAGDLVAVEPAR
jgi:hypothetical protein